MKRESLVKNSNIGNDVILLKCNLLSSGMSLSPLARNNLKKFRHTLTIRNGIAGGLDIKLHSDVYVNVPIKETFSNISPYLLNWDEESDCFILEKNGKIIQSVEVLPLPSFVGVESSKKVPFEQIGQLFTDRLGLYPFKGCIHTNKSNKACQFCEVPIEDRLTLVNIDQMVELVKFCLNSTDINFRHILLSGGTPKNTKSKHLVDSINSIRNITNVPLYMMLEPHIAAGIMNDLYVAGLDEIAFNIELYDRTIARKLMPGKSRNSLRNYFESFNKAKKIWTKPYSVRTAFLVGLESTDSTLLGVEHSIKEGVLPTLSPFRPIKGTSLERMSPSSGEIYYRTWSEAQNIAEKHSYTLGPICIACQHNSLAFPVNKIYKYY